MKCEDCLSWERIADGSGECLMARSAHGRVNSGTMMWAVCHSGGNDCNAAVITAFDFSCCMWVMLDRRE